MRRKNWNLESNRPRFESQLCKPPGCPILSLLLNFLSLSFLTCKMRIIVPILSLATFLIPLSFNFLICKMWLIIAFSVYLMVLQWIPFICSLDDLADDERRMFAICLTLCTYLNSSIPSTTLGGRWLYYHHSTDEETEATYSLSVYSQVSAFIQPWLPTGVLVFSSDFIFS